MFQFYLEQFQMIIFLKSNSHSRFLQKIRHLILVNVNNKKELNIFVLLSCISPKVADNCNFCEIFNGLKKYSKLKKKFFPIDDVWSAYECENYRTFSLVSKFNRKRIYLGASSIPWAKQ